jgi:hypothetical protein
MSETIQIDNVDTIFKERVVQVLDLIKYVHYLNYKATIFAAIVNSGISVDEAVSKASEVAQTLDSQFASKQETDV